MTSASADFRRLWIAAGFNSAGYSGEHLILGLLVFQITGSTAWVGASMAVYALPNLVFGILSGVITDWLDRRTLLRVLDFLIGLNLAPHCYARPRTRAGSEGGVPRLRDLRRAS